MNSEHLRALFERLCARLDDDATAHQLHFRGAVGVEFPQGVVMVFIFDRQVLICEFQADQVPEHEPSEALSADECLDMIDCLQGWEGSLTDIFSD